MKGLFTLIMTLFLAGSMYGQTVTGTIVDMESNEPLFGASVVVRGTTNGTITDIDGRYTLKANVGDMLDVAYLGYQNASFEVTSTDMGMSKMEAGGIGLEEVVVTGVVDIVRDRRTPVAVSTVGIKEIQAKAIGNVEFPEVMKNTPSVYVSNQTGFGDAQMFLRGFNQINTAFLLNGQPINGMEDGRMYWSNWSGMSDVSSAVQVQRGLGSSKLAISSVGGTINIVTKTVDKKKGGYARLVYGNDNYLKGTVAYNSGLQGKWAYSILLDHWQADRKWAEGTNGQGQNYFVSVGFKPNAKNTFNFLITGAPQWHGQRWSQSAETLAETPKYNQHFNDYQGEFLTERRNYYHKPVVNLSWDHKISAKTKLSSVLYGSLGRGGGTGNFGRGRVRDADGRPDWDAIEAQNGDAVNGIGTFNDNYALRASVNNHNWFGNVTNIETDLSENVTLSGGIDIRFYQGDHFRQLVNLFGLEGWNESFQHQTRPSDYVVTETYKARPWAALFNFADEDQRVDYDYSENINYQGLFSQLEYSKNQFSAFIQGAVSNQSYKRIGRWADIGETDVLSKVGYNVKGGGSYQLNLNNTVFVNAGYYSRQPFLDNIFEDIRNSSTLLVPDVENEKITGLEVGYKYFDNRFNANVNVFSTTWGNRTRVSTFFNDNGTPDNEDDDFQQRDVERGIEQNHLGVEVDAAYKITDGVRVRANFAAGDYTFKQIESLTTFNDDTGEQLSEVEGEDIDGVHIAGVPQLSLGLGASAEILDGLSLYADYNFYDDIYIRGSSDILSEDIGTLDSYGSLDFGAGYKFSLGKQKLELRGNLYNLLDNDAITQTDRFGLYIMNGLTWNTSVKLHF